MSDERVSGAPTTAPASTLHASHAQNHLSAADAPHAGGAGAAAVALHADAHHVLLEQKRFLAVYGVLIVGTVLTVAMYYVHFEAMWQTVGAALLIAAVKGAFVAAVFMHLWHGERDIYRILLYTGVVVVGLFVLSICSIFSVPGAGLYLR
jgi:caa(3)-type oxidase subunit IV